MPTHKLTPEIINAAIVGFEQQKRRIDDQIAELRSLLPGDSAGSDATTEAAPRKRKKFSAAARRRMRDAQRLRWANSRGESSAPAKPEPAKHKRKLSAAGRAAIITATKKRWAAKKTEVAKAKQTSTKPRTKKAGKKAAAMSAAVE